MNETGGDDERLPGDVRVELPKENEVEGVLETEWVDLVFDEVEWLE